MILSQRIFWIESGAAGRLAIVARPDAAQLAKEIAAWRAAGITAVASLLVSDEACELGLLDEPRLCRDHGIDFISFPIADRGIPDSLDPGLALARRLAHAIEAGGTAAVHCRACIGRSGMLAAVILISLGHREESALCAIAAGRGLRVPETPEQRGWVTAAATALGRP